MYKACEGFVGVCLDFVHMEDTTGVGFESRASFIQGKHSAN